MLDTTVQDSVESLLYWRRRRARLPWYRRSARREAGRMVVVWERRVRAAVLRPGELPAALRLEAGLAVARSLAARWARRLGMTMLAMLALASACAGAMFALVIQVL